MTQETRLPDSKGKCTIEELKWQSVEASQLIQDLRAERYLGLLQLHKMCNKIVRMEEELCKLQSTSVTKKNFTKRKCKAQEDRQF